ncbi:DUF5959 family protein [Streptomyces sp. NBC_01255]|uniref:DUF5959 family protein n=1 Tax=Streptomyces sp. NBC_01255 TaxID=2903798 RepID=UPI002E3495E3|nr:DUF5959 family protein [Streptomyces sp. NBC_01255]
MEAQGPIDLIHLAGIEGNSVVVRVTGQEIRASQHDPDVLVGEISVGTSFVAGSLKTWIFPQDLADWETALNTLAGGGSTSWREDKRATELHIDLEEGLERATVSVADRSMSLATVQVTIELADGWIEDHRARLGRVRQAWPMRRN